VRVADAVWQSCCLLHRRSLRLLCWCGAVVWTCRFLLCSGPREDATRIGSAGVVRRQAVDISPLRRVNQVAPGPMSVHSGAPEGAMNDILRAAAACADAAGCISPVPGSLQSAGPRIVRVACCSSCSRSTEEWLLAAGELVRPIGTRSQ
jgi:hypothetical protein